MSWPISYGSTLNCSEDIHSLYSDCSPHSSFGSTLTGLPLMFNICSCLSWPICGGISVTLLLWMDSVVSGSWNSCLGSCDIWLFHIRSVCRCGSWKMHSGTSPNLLLSISKNVSLGNFPILTGSYCRLLPYNSSVCRFCRLPSSLGSLLIFLERRSNFVLLARLAQSFTPAAFIKTACSYFSSDYLYYFLFSE